MTVHKMVLRLLVVGVLFPHSAWAGEVHNAARTGDVTRLVALLADKPDLINAPDGNGRTPLHLAACFGHRNVVEALLARGADIETRDRHGRRPIDAASSRNHREIVNLLVEQDVVRLTERVYRITLLHGVRPNIGVSLGQDSMLLIDTGERQVAERMKSVVYALNKDGPKYVINTHLHLDHIGGNAIVGEGATIIDYTNLEQRVSEGLLSPGKGPLRGRTGRSFDTYYSMRFNGEEIRLIPAAGAHSNADILIHFTDSGIVHMGALLLTESFPGISGQLKRYLDILDTTIDVFPPDTIFLAGHGREYNLDQLRKYRGTLQDAIDAVVSHIKAGKSIEQMQRENVLEEWEWLGQWLSFLDTDYWIRTVYNSGIAQQDDS